MKRTPLLGLSALLLLPSLNPRLSTCLGQGTAFTYQGKLGVGTNAANGTYDLTFALFSVSSGAGQLGNTQTNLATSISNGLFTVALDFGASFPGQDRWLEIGVRTNGNGAFTTLAPRQKLTPAPYAIYAGNAAQIGGQSPTAFVGKAGDTMTGTLNLPANGLNVGSGQLAVSGGKVGIGTPSPSDPLTVRTSPDQKLLVRANGSLPDGISLWSDGDSGFKGLEMVGSAIQLQTVQGPNLLTFATSGTERMRVDAAGAVGIGISPSTDGILNLGGDVHINDHYLFMRTGTDRFHGLGYANTVAGASVDGPWLFGYGGGALGSSSPDAIALRWDRTGNVGIGTTSPGDRLSIRGGALSFHDPYANVPYVGMDYDSTGDALRIRANISSAQLNTDLITIKRPSRAGTGLPQWRLSALDQQPAQQRRHRQRHGFLSQHQR